MQCGNCSSIIYFLWIFISLCCAISDTSTSTATIRHSISRLTTRWKREKSEDVQHLQQYIMTFNDHKKATITRHSNFLQTFKLGYKLILMCEAEGYPEPSIKWYKDGAEMNIYHTTYLSRTPTRGHKVRTRLEIDPATIGDQGVYSCLASNRYGRDLKSIKTLYQY